MAIDALPQLTKEEALKRLSAFLRPDIEQRSARKRLMVDEFAERHYYIQGDPPQPIKLLPHQKSILRFALHNPKMKFQTIIYSCPKKSGKTSIAGLVARYVAETFGAFQEVFCLANDREQARGRIYQAALQSIELDPAYDPGHKSLPNEWRLIERQALHLPSKSFIRAVSNDYKGEAGSNPTATFWSELWGFQHDSDERMYTELTPVPTRPHSFRWIETYAGYEGESGLLEKVWEQAKEGRQLTHDDIDWPWKDQPIPIWVNETAKIFAYIDQGEIARRMPWQTPDYYAVEASDLTPNEFLRLHSNFWVSPAGEFVPIEWWDACYDPDLGPLGEKEPIVIGVDAAVSSDCCAVVGVSRNPKNKNDVAIRFAKKWDPPKGGTIDYSSTIEPYIREMCAKYNVKQVAYDVYQLHKLMTDLRNDRVAWCKQFSQAGDRNKADKQLFDVIRDRRLSHPGLPDLREHFSHAAAKQSRDEDSKLRIIKRSQDQKIDLVVATSMAVSECLRLLLA